jgi:plexin A
MCYVFICGLSFKLGYLDYEIESKVPVDIIVGVVGFILLVGIVLITVFVVKYRPNKQDRRDALAQLNRLESNVRDQYKQAFVEPQTEIPVFTRNLRKIGVPFWDYRTYTFKLLFANSVDHSVLHNSSDSPNYCFQDREVRDHNMAVGSHLRQCNHFIRQT